MTIRMRACATPADYAAAASLFRAYARELGVDLAFQDFEAELADLPAQYGGHVGGALLLAWQGDTAVGCVGVRRMRGDTCEMKRLYVVEPWRALKLGRRLAERSLQEAWALGYAAMRLDTLERLKAALALYRDLGFREIPAYYDNPLDGVVYMERALKPAPTLSARSRRHRRTGADDPER